MAMNLREVKVDFGFNLRRIVTGHDDNGRSIVAIDGPPGRDSGELFEIWHTNSSVENSRDHADRGMDKINLSPATNGSNCRWFVVPPSDGSVSDQELEKDIAEWFAAMGAAHERPDTTRHPGMHKTKTVDYVIVLSGRVTLLLDDDERDLKPFDVVVQRGTNHAWINNSKEPALLCGILIDAEIR